MGRGKALTIESLDRGVDLLEILAQRETVKLAELPAMLESSRATAFRVLKTLQGRGFVEHLPDQQVYRLGPKAILLGARSRMASFVRLAEPIMAEIRNRTGETVNLAVFRGGHLDYVEILEGRHALRMTGNVGDRVPLHATALGKATLARLSEQEQLALVGRGPYEAFTPRTVQKWDALKRQVAAAAKNGYAVDLEEMDTSAICVGATISEGGRPVGGLSVSGFAERLAEPARSEIGELLRDRCERISAELQASVEAAAVD